MAESAHQKMAKLSVLSLYAAGIRFVSDYDEHDAVDHYLELHPDADRAAVEAELRAAIDEIE